MPERSEQAISIHAAPAQIMAVIADFEAYPEWARHIKSVEILARGGPRAERVRFTIDASVFKDTYVLAYHWDGDRSVRWSLVEGEIQRTQDGSYLLEPSADGSSTTVTYQLSVDLAIPMLGMLKRRAEKVIMDTALRELKKRVETAG